jgi:GNAT superfamily N-acetyltransferase
VIKISSLKRQEIPEADRIFRLAFGTLLGLPNTADFMGDRDLLTPRWRSKHVAVLAARERGRLIGTNVVTRWGSFGFFGPLTVLPEYWDRGVGQRLLEETMSVFDRWGVRHTGLYTLPHSPKHVGLYQKFGYWPRFLTAIMTRTPEAAATAPVLLSTLPKAQKEEAIRVCAKLAGKIDKGLDLTEEIRAVLQQRIGDVVLTYTRKTLDGFAVCHSGPGSEGGAKVCYVKFAAALGGDGFTRLLEAIDAYGGSRGVSIEAGVNLAREDACKRMRAHGYRTTMQGVAMHRPHAAGFNHADAYVIDDWR